LKEYLEDYGLLMPDEGYVGRQAPGCVVMLPGMMNTLFSELVP
jgi:hypothetical protein